jgi:hypothetical protein
MKAMLKYGSLLLVLMLVDSKAWACEACKKQQPEITQGLTHGTGPQGNLDWVIIAGVTLITLLTLFYSLKYLIKPQEADPDHIKQSILIPEGNE